jgi:NADPH-dependent 2,4-dienoyl-CoA reductase/sulfur reductase-like enzyme
MFAKRLARIGVLGVVGGALAGGFIAHKAGVFQEASMKTEPPKLDLEQLRKTFDKKEVDSKRQKIVLKSRDDHLKEVESTPEYDVVIIGGGCTGGGVALNTAAYGLSTLLIEAYDFSSGTSSKSTKLLHGGRSELPQGTAIFSKYST